MMLSGSEFMIALMLLFDSEDMEGGTENARLD